MKKVNLSWKPVLLMLFMFLILSCSKKLERYEDPPWLGGTSIETLEKAGNYTIFLQLMEKAEYKNTVTKQLTTLFVPDDEAFRKFFQKRGINSINDLSDEEALELFTQHIISNPVNANHLVYEKAWNRLESETGEYRSLFFRKPLKSIAPPYIEIPKYDKTHKGNEIYIYGGSKFLPLFSIYYFKDYNGVDSIDYPFMYPENKWNSLMHWHNATILPVKGKENSTNIEDLANPTASGFIYYLDRVVDPMPTIEKYLYKNQDKYGLFYDLMQRFAVYTQSTVKDLKNRKLYTKTYDNLPNIAGEGGPGGGLEGAMLNMFTVFLPDNNVLQTYLNDKVLNTYSNIDEVPAVTLRYILQSQMTNRLELKSKFTKVFYNVYGDKSAINPADVEPGYMCSNGVIYNSKRIMEPSVFQCVPATLFFNKNYSTFLTMLSSASMIPALSGEKEVTLFAPTNDQLLAANIRLIVNSKGVQEIQQKGSDEKWIALGANDLTIYVQDHIYNGKISDLNGEGFVEMYSHNYVYFNNNKISAGLNKFVGNTAGIVEQRNEKNGILYFIDNPIRTKYRMGEFIVADPELSEFKKLMVISTLLDLNFVESSTKYKYPNIKITEATDAYYWTLFAPKNSAIDQLQSEGKLPHDTLIDKYASGALKAPADVLNKIKELVNYHLVKDVIFDDGNKFGSIPTLLANSNLAIANSINNLTITDGSGQVVQLNHADANNIVRRGVVHKITSVLKNK